MEIVVLTVIILLNGFFALSEIALVSSKKSRLEQKMASGSKGAEIALKLLDSPDNFLSAIQVGITLIGIVTGMYGGMNIASDFVPYVLRLGVAEQYAGEIALALTVIVITYFSIVAGELVPKTLAMSNPEKIAVRVAPLVYYFSWAFYPFVQLLSVSTSLTSKILGIKRRTELVTEAELRQMFKSASTDGVIEDDQNLIHEKVFYFSDKKAKHIMTHRTDVEWIDIDRSPSAIKAELFGAQHSKLVCCRGELDNFVGMLNVRNYFKQQLMNESFDIQDIITEPLVVPATVDARIVLNLLRENNVPLCCVINEYGGLEGIITLHDIMENIVGQIPDEGESYEPDVFVREDKSVLVSGDAPVEVLVGVIDDFTVDFDKIDYSTVAGFVFEQINKIPQLGDVFEYNGYFVEIVDMDDKKIDKVLIRRMMDDDTE